MSKLEDCIIEELKASFVFGVLAKHIPGSHCIFMFSDLTSNKIDGFWVKLVLRFTECKLVNGIFEMPMIQLRNYAIIWVKDFRIICCAGGVEEDGHFLKKQRPSLPSAITLAIGGPTGVGKTTLIHKLLTSSIGCRVKRYVAYTTRPSRCNEVDGVDYRFVEITDISSYQNNPRFTGFTEARGHWYWFDPLEFFRARWTEADAIHIFSITQVHEFLARRELAPDLQWIWLDARSEVLRSRLEKRGDQNVEQSLDQSKRLKKQDRRGLVSFCIDAEAGNAEDLLAQLLGFIQKYQEKRT